MNTVIVYDSAFGNTEQIAQAIAGTFREDGQVRIVRVEHTHPLYLHDVDLLVLGCPTQKRRPTPAMRSLLEYIPAEALNRLAVACFDTRFSQSSRITGSAARWMARKLSKRGASHLLPGESFLVKGTHGPLENGEVERAISWARMLQEKGSVSRVAMQ
jgi:flavodoxin